MTKLEMIRDWYAYNARVRLGYLASFAKLPKEELHRDRGASYPTMFDIFEHVLEAYLFWIITASTGNSTLPQVNRLADDDSSTPSLELVSKEEEQVQSVVKGFLDGLIEEDLYKTFLIHLDRDHKVSVRVMLWQLVEEELQHRGELNALLWQIYVDPPIFDWIEWVEKTAA